MKSIQISDVLFQAVDGYPLSGRVYEPQGRLVGTIVVAGATGVQQKLYRRFAEYEGWQTNVKNSGPADSTRLGTDLSGCGLAGRRRAEDPADVE